ncbi:MAG: M28 family metallopeptidase [Acidobacteria bacterium]|nr:M28 family metallopeptidase [Acidobacteriota bacterium]
MYGGPVGSEPETTLGAVAWRHAARLAALGPRVPGSAAHDRARAYIVETLTALPGWQVQVQPFTVGVQRYVNVIAVWPEPAEVPGWLFSAHYDTVPGSPGALDNATGVGLLLALAEHWSRHIPPRPVVLGFWDGEETGLLGSTLYAHRYATGDAKPIPHLMGHLSLEMVGWSQGTSCFHTFRYPWSSRHAHPLAPPWLVRHSLRTAQTASLAPRLGDPYLSYPYQWAIRNVRIPFASDDAPFARVGVPSIFVADASFVRFYPAYHSQSDRIEQASAERLDRYARWLLQVVETPSESATDQDQAYWVFGSWVLSGAAFRWSLIVLGIFYGVLALTASAHPAVRWGRLLVPLGLALWKPAETLALLIPSTLLAGLGHLQTDPWVPRFLSVLPSLVYWSGPLLTVLAMARFPGIGWTLEGLILTVLMLAWFLLLQLR